MKTLPSLSIFLPVYNDEHTIASLINAAYRYGNQHTRNLEVIVVNDGSFDNSSHHIIQLKKKYPDLRVVTHKKNRGYGAALIAGFKAATKDWIFYTDADGQYDIKELDRLVRKVTKDIDVVNGYKLARSDNVFRTIGGSLYNTLIHWLYDIPITDIDCDFRLIKRKYLRHTLTAPSGAVCTELIVRLQRAGAHFAEVGVHHYARKHGRSQFLTVKNLLATLKDHIRLYKTLHR